MKRLIVLCTWLVVLGCGPAPQAATQSPEPTVAARPTATQTPMAPTASPTASRPAITATPSATGPSSIGTPQRRSAPTADSKSLEATVVAGLMASQTATFQAQVEATLTAIAVEPHYAELESRWNAVAAGVIVTETSVAPVNFLWEDDRFPHPTFKGGSAEAYGAFARVLLAFFQQGDNFDYLAANCLFTVNLRYGTMPTPGWTFANLTEQFSRPDALGSHDMATRSSLESYWARIQALPK